ncbi:MAG: FAD-dependent oxidoreductase [Acidobacteria bacterium]|nr:MAG: FAD-dependent oxidoreductase [Acidobacteriota bacterium]GIK77124.1 MAG: pyridine nucleotide-disulfide oxidoreductase [Actinomycetes bacterium]
MSKERHVIVGGGLAGAKAAEALRAEGHEGEIVLIGAEDELPYERPPLSKDYLRGESSRDDARVHPEGFYEEQEIELRIATSVTAIDPGAREVELDGGERLGWDRLLLATGSEPRRLPLPGADLDGVHHLRDLGDSDAISARLEPGARLVVVGAGWIGSEVAASARQKGAEVEVVERAPRPLEHVLGAEASDFYAAVHREHGVVLRTGAALERFEGTGRVEGVLLGDGTRIDCDAVVVGVGIVPRTGLAEEAGLEVENGVVTDERLATSAEGVFACGDVANAHHPFYGRRLRVEHWANALHQPEVAARAMLGKEASYDRVPYFFSDQYDVGMEYAGYATEWDRIAFRGDPGGGEFIAFWLRDGRVVAGMNVNVWDVTDPIQELIRSRKRVDADRLVDPGVPLERLLERSDG